MKTILPQKICLAAFGVAVALSAHGQTVRVDDDFESPNYFSVGSLNWGETAPAGGWSWNDEALLELKSQDPDGTTNKSVLIMDGGSLTHDLFQETPFPAPTNEEPQVFSFRLYDTMETDPDSGELLVRQSFGTYRQNGGFNHFVAAGIWSDAQTGTFDKTRYQARVMSPTGNWYQLATERSLGWQHFKIVIHYDSVDIWVNGVLDPNGVALPREPNINILDYLSFGGGHAVHIDDVRLAIDPSEARAIEVTQQPSPLTLAVGDEAVFSVVASSGGALTYQWKKDGVDLFDGSGISGAETATLTIASVGSADTAVYRVTISDGTATQDSAGAQLTVHPFIFLQQPEGMVLEFGETATFVSEVHGEGTFTYQWQKDGVDVMDGGKISGATTSTLTITDVQAGDTGSYTVVVENLHGQRTSDSAALSGGPPATGVRFGEFEEFDAPTTNGTVMFRQPSYSGSSRGLLTTPNTTQVVDEFPAGTWGAKVLRTNFAFNPDFTGDPWLRLTTHNVANLGNPIIGFDRWLRFEIYSTEDVWVTLGVKEAQSTGDFGTNGGYPAGDLQWVGGSAEDPGPAGVPQKGVLVTAGSWQTVAFDLPNEFIKPFAGTTADDKLDGIKGTMEQLAFQPVRAEDNSYPSVFEIFLDNFETTEVAPVIEPPPSGVVPTVSATRGAGGDIELVITGDANTAYTVEWVENLGDAWQVLGTETTNPSGDATFIDAGATTSASRRFYRVVIP